ncbi:hypothetical protein [Pseudomonas sp. WS 5027]|uniref:hypothetical protein n=1 Tax=Pseudomonas sp. WS 5027 TaxID=2717483 RepID=UPI001475A073|nr:hypothetical protein [Pseudomonas sp. WS 5027]NMY49319.1 hypothetical protein [Pseudomonas sp. WS 5027]
MGENDISARLRALATDDKRRPETARLRDVFDDVETALGAGVPQADVLAELHQAGFTMTMASFKSALQRIRKERAGGVVSKPKTVAPSIEENSNKETKETASATQQATNEEEEDLENLSSEEARKVKRERKAQQFIKSESTNPLVKKLMDQQKDKDQ